MRRRKLSWIWATAILTSLAAVTAPAFPNVKEKTDSSADPRQTVESILQQQEQLLRGQRFIYDPGIRRDPFQSLYDFVKEGDGPRPAGIEGMSIEEIDLTGIVEDPGGNVAYFTGSDNKGYFLRVGQRVYQATMIAVDPSTGSVTFRQEVDDPRQIKPYRDVVRRLVQSDEGRR